MMNRPKIQVECLTDRTVITIFADSEQDSVNYAPVVKRAAPAVDKQKDKTASGIGEKLTKTKKTPILASLTDQIIEELKKKTPKTVMAKALGVSLPTLYNYINKHIDKTKIGEPVATTGNTDHEFHKVGKFHVEQEFGKTYLYVVATGLSIRTNIDNVKSLYPFKDKGICLKWLDDLGKNLTRERRKILWFNDREERDRALNDYETGRKKM